MSRISALGTAAAISAIVAMSQPALAQVSCSWPMSRVIFKPAQYIMFPVAPSPLSFAPAGPLIAAPGRIVTAPPPQPPPPRLVSREMRTVVQVLPTRGDPEAVRMELGTEVDVADLIANFPNLVQSSDGWRAFQSQLDCENRAKDYEFTLDLDGRELVGRIGFVVERHVCLPGGGGFRAAGARFSSETRMALTLVGGQIQPVVTSVRTNVRTSPEQDMFLGLLDFAVGSLVHPLGVEMLRDLQSRAVRELEMAAETNLRTMTLPAVGLPQDVPLPPDFHLDNYSADFARSPFGTVVAHVDSHMLRGDSRDIRDRFACAMMRNLPAATR